jgi:hypothetical protein
MSVAAFARAGTETRQPCVNRTPALWYGEKINNWRDCLEALMAGDFLTPTIIGLTFTTRSGSDGGKTGSAAGEVLGAAFC